MEEQETPPRIKPKIKSAPKIRQIFWCDFPNDAQLPEFWKKRPVLVISKNAKLHDNVIVLPMTTKSQPDNPMAYPVSSPLDGKQAWIICDYITTVSVSRLSAGHHIPRLSNEHFDKVLILMLQNLPKPNY